MSFKRKIRIVTISLIFILSFQTEELGAQKSTDNNFVANKVWSKETFSLFTKYELIKKLEYNSKAVVVLSPESFILNINSMIL